MNLKHVAYRSLQRFPHSELCRIVVVMQGQLTKHETGQTKKTKALGRQRKQTMKVKNLLVLSSTPILPVVELAFTFPCPLK